MNRSPQFLVAWDSRWREFFSAVPVAFSRSAPRIALEGQRPNLVPRLTESFLFHVAIIIAFCIFLQRDIASPPLLDPAKTLSDVGIVYFQEKLPEIGDAEGAREGSQGRAGGQATFHAQQVIRVARGEQPAPMVAFSSPSIRLPNFEDRPGKHPGPQPSTSHRPRGSTEGQDGHQRSQAEPATIH